MVLYILSKKMPYRATNCITLEYIVTIAMVTLIMPNSDVVNDPLSYIIGSIVKKCLWCIFNSVYCYMTLIQVMLFIP